MINYYGVSPGKQLRDGQRLFDDSLHWQSARQRNSKSDSTMTRTITLTMRLIRLSSRLQCCSTYKLYFYSATWDAPAVGQKVGHQRHERIKGQSKQSSRRNQPRTTLDIDNVQHIISKHFVIFRLRYQRLWRRRTGCGSVLVNISRSGSLDCPFWYELAIATSSTRHACIASFSSGFVSWQKSEFKHGFITWQPAVSQKK